MRCLRRRTLVALVVLVPFAGLAPLVSPALAASPGDRATVPAARASATGLSSVTATPGSVTAATGATAADGTTVETIDATSVVALTPDRPGSVRVRLEFTLPTAVTDLTIALPNGTTVTGTDGFRPASDGYEWTGEERPTLTYTLDVNRSERAEGPLSGRGEYSFVDAGSWALVREPGFGARWEWVGSEDVRIDRSVTTAGSGAVGDTMVYLGPYEEHTRLAHDQRFRLIVPTAANMTAAPDAVLASLANASGTLQVGDRDRSVFAVAAPTDTVGWTARGLQTGDADFWVRDMEGVDTPENVWLHEYVHTRQAFSRNVAPSATWLTEGMANYYAAVLPLERGRIGFDPFRRELAAGADERYADTVLAEPDTWARYADYEKGALVAGTFDRRIRLATDQRATLATVWRRLNAAEGTVDHQRLKTAIREVTNRSVAIRLGVFATTSDTPSMWTREQHRRAFGPLPARITATIPDSGTSYRITGPYRNRSVDVIPTLVPGEQLAVDVRIENRGGQAGTYAIPVSMNDTTIATLTGTVGARDATTRTVTYDVTATGRRTLRAGDTTVAFSVSPPATPTVTSIRIATDAPTAGTETTVTATVSNDAAVPGRRRLTVAVDGRALANRTVRLDAGATGEVTVTTTFAAGTHRITAGNRSRTIDVAPEPTGTGTADGQAGTTASATDGPGFAISGTLLAVVTAVVLARRRRT